MQHSTTPRWLLVAGLLAGIVMAASGVLEDRDGDLPSQAVARVNERLILRDAWLRAVAAVSSERRTPLTDADRRHILDRLVDEELLAQHGLALGLVEQDRRLRAQLVQQVMQTAGAASAGREFSDDELRGYYTEHRDFFTPPARLRVSAIQVDANGQRIPFLPPVPDVLLPPAELRTYLGPSLTRAILELQPGETSLPIAHGAGHAVVEVLQREPGTTPPFEQVREQVSAEMQRRADEEAVRRLLQQLREDNSVVVSDELG
jgi:hypothetical protein